MKLAKNLKKLKEKGGPFFSSSGLARKFKKKKNADVEEAIIGGSDEAPGFDYWWR